MEIPEELYYTKDHEWARVESNIVTVGITDYAQGELGDVIYVELPALNSRTAAGEPFGTIEAVKTVADLFAPVSGEVKAVNTALEESPEKVNNDPYGEGWIIKIEMEDRAELKNLLSASDYEKLIVEV